MTPEWVQKERYRLKPGSDPLSASFDEIRRLRVSLIAATAMIFVGSTLGRMAVHAVGWLPLAKWLSITFLMGLALTLTWFAVFLAAKIVHSSAFGWLVFPAFGLFVSFALALLLGLPK